MCPRNPPKKAVEGLTVARDVATKSDIAEVRTEIAELRTELKSDIAEGRAEIAEVRNELKADIAEMRTAIVQSEVRLVRWFLTIAGVMVAVLGFMIKLL